MQPSHSVFAIGIGAVIAIGSYELASSQAALSIDLQSIPAISDRSPEHYKSNLAFTSRLQHGAQPTPPDSLIELHTIKSHSVLKGRSPESSEAAHPDSEIAQASSVDATEEDVPADEIIEDEAPIEGSEPDANPIEAETLTDDEVSTPDENLEPASPGAPGAPIPLNDPDMSAPSNDPSVDELSPSSDEPASPEPTNTLPEITPLEAESATPEYLIDTPNPLTFPTDPEEVRILGTQPITLEQAIEIARRNSNSLQTALVQLEQSRASFRQTRAARFPTLSAGSSLTRTEDLNSSQGNGGNGLGDISLTGIDASGQPVSVPLDALTNTDGFSQDADSTDFSATLDLSYDIFTSGQRRARIRAAERAVRVQELQVEVVLEELRLDVTNAYYNLQEADENVRITRDTLEESLRSLQDALALERAGVGTRFDRLQAEVDVANSRQELRNSIRDQLVSRRELVTILSVPPGIDLAAADPVEVAGIWEPSLEESIVLALQNRAELEQQVVQRELNQQQRRAELASYGPQVSTFAQYQVQDEFNNGSSARDAFQVGVQLNLLLFDGGASRAAAAVERADIELAEIEFASASDQIRFDVEQSYLDLQANFENIDTARAAVLLAEESLRLARLRFQAGVGIQSDVLQAQTDLTQAQVNLVTAILGYNRALVALQRSVSNLPDSYLNDVP